MVSDRGVGPLMSGPCVSGEDVLVQKGRPVEKKGEERRKAAVCSQSRLLELAVLERGEKERKLILVESGKGWGVGVVMVSRILCEVMIS